MSYNLVWLFTILQCIAVTKCHVEYTDDYYQETTEGADVRWALASKNYMRCTRRFTPGHCVTPLRPVWTYGFQEYKCIERLGCRARSRFNRFDSRESCELRCRDLMMSNYIGRSRNRTDDHGHNVISRRRMYYAEGEKMQKYARDEKEEDDARQQDDGPLETDDDDDRYTTAVDIDAPDDDNVNDV